jgi:hypothetical protein
VSTAQEVFFFAIGAAGVVNPDGDHGAHVNGDYDPI